MVATHSRSLLLFLSSVSFFGVDSASRFQFLRASPSSLLHSPEDADVVSMRELTDSDGSDDCVDCVVGPTDCFSADTLVSVLGKGDVPLKHVKVGDKILAPKQEYQTVYAFGHRDEEELSDFIQIRTNASKTPLEMTEYHLLFVLDSKGQPSPIPAGSLQIGDTLLLQEGHLATVVELDMVRRLGIYAPLTTNGQFLANGIHVSSYISLQFGAPHGKTLFSNGWTPGITHHFLTHMFLAPFRVACLSFAHCDEEDDSTTMPSFVEQGLRFAHTMDACPFWLQTIVFSLVVLVAGLFWVTEVIWGPVLAGPVFILGSVFAGSFLLKVLLFPKQYHKRSSV